jgi:hypothetical protein
VARKVPKRGTTKSGKPDRRGGKRPGAGNKGIKVYTDEAILEALRRHDGLVALAAEDVGCDPCTIYVRFKERPELREMQQTFRNALADVAEDRLRKKVKEGDWFAVRYALDTLGRDRGYVTRVETRMGGDKGAPPIQVQSGPMLTDAQLDALPDHVKEVLLAVLNSATPGDNQASPAPAQEPPA